MQTVYYIGPNRAVEVSAANNALAKRNAPFEVSDELAASLLEQEENWATAPVGDPEPDPEPQEELETDLEDPATEESEE